MDGMQELISAHAASSSGRHNKPWQRGRGVTCEQCSGQYQPKYRGKHPVCASSTGPTSRGGQSSDSSDSSAAPSEVELAAQCGALELLGNQGADAAHSKSSSSSSSSSSAEEKEEDEEGRSTSAEESCASLDQSSDESGSGDDAAYGDGPGPAATTEHATKCRSLERMILGLPGGEQWLSAARQPGGRKWRGAGASSSRHSGTSRGSTTAPGSSLASFESESDSDRASDDETSSSGSDSNGAGGEAGSGGEDDASGDVQRRLSWGAALVMASASSEHASECRSLEAMISHLTDTDGDDRSGDHGSGDSSEEEEESGDEEEGSCGEEVEASAHEGSSDGDASTSAANREPGEGGDKEAGALCATPAAGGSCAAEAAEAAEAEDEAEAEEETEAVAVRGAALSQLPDHMLSLVLGCVVEISDGTEVGRRDWRRHRRAAAAADDDDDKSTAHAPWATAAASAAAGAEAAAADVYDDGDADEEGGDDEDEVAPFSWAPYSAAALATHAARTATLRLVSQGCRDALASGGALRACVAQGQLLNGGGRAGLMPVGLAALKVVPPDTRAPRWTDDDDEREQVQVAAALRLLLAPHWRQLRVLDLAYVHLDASLIAVDVANGCPQLEALSVAHCEAVDDAAVVALAHGTCAGTLRALNVTACRYDGLGDAAVAALAARCPKLASLRIGYAGALTDAGVACLAQRRLALAPLVEFCAPHCEKLTDAGLLLLAGHDPNEIVGDGWGAELDRQGRDYSVQGRAAAAQRAASWGGSGSSSSSSSTTATTAANLACPSCTLRQTSHLQTCALCGTPLLPPASQRAAAVTVAHSGQVAAGAQWLPSVGTARGAAALQAAAESRGNGNGGGRFVSNCANVPPPAVDLTGGGGGGNAAPNAASRLQRPAASVPRAAVRRLRVFDVSACPHVGTRGVVAVVRRAGPWLRYLDLGGCDGVDAAACCAALAACPGLRVARLTDWYSLSDAALLEAARHCPHLEALDLAFTLVPSPVVSALALAQLPALLPKLVSLNLSYLEHVNDVVVAAVARGCPQLRELRLAYCVQVTDEGLRAVAAHLGPTLQVLSLHSDDQCTDAGLVAVCRGCPHLAELDAAFLRFLTDAAVDAILAHCARLVKLALHGCLQITKTARARVQQVWDEQAAAARRGGEYAFGGGGGDAAAALDPSGQSSDEEGSDEEGSDEEGSDGGDEGRA